MQVQPPSQTQRAAAATTAVLVVSEGKVVWAGVSGQALVELAGEARGENPDSGLAQIQKCCQSPRTSLEHGGFKAWLIHLGTKCSSSRVCYMDGAKKKKHPQLQSSRLDSRKQN